MKKITIIIPAAENTAVEALKGINSKEVRILIERGKNPPQNRNKGIDKAKLKNKTPFIAFINAHTILDKKWVKEVLKFFKKYPEIDIVGGPQLSSSKEKLFARASGYALSSIFGSALASSRYKKTKLNLHADESILTSANLICRERVFDKVRFDETIYPGEDPTFIEDSIKAGFRVAYSPEITVYNLRRQDIGSFFEQVFGYGRTRPQKESLLLTVKKPYFLIPSLFILYLAVLPSLLLISRYILLPLAGYFLLDAIFAIYESQKNNELMSSPLLLLLFPLIHIAYGLGFIYGTLTKNRNKQIVKLEK